MSSTSLWNRMVRVSPHSPLAPPSDEPPADPTTPTRPAQSSRGRLVHRKVRPPTPTPIPLSFPSFSLSRVCDLQAMTDLTTLLAVNPAGADSSAAAAPQSSSSSSASLEKKPRSGSVCVVDGAVGAGLRALHEASVAVVDGVQAVRASLQLVGDANAACSDTLVDESQPDTACARQAVQKMQDLAKRLDVLLIGVGHTLQEGVVDAFTQLPPTPPPGPDSAAEAEAASLAVNACFVRSFQTTLRALQFALSHSFAFCLLSRVTLFSFFFFFFAHQNVL